MGFLEMKKVSFTYPNGYEAIKDVDLNFEKGESVAIIGQNGAGKTTTVKLMNGLLKPTTGNVFVDGVDTKTKTTAQIAKIVGYVFQNPDDQIFQETIYKEISFGLIHKKNPSEAVKKRILEAAKLCQLDSFLEEHPYNLPYSKRKFITIAAIIAMDTQVIIFDEPTAGQDRESTELLGDIITTLKKRGKTVITITHDMEFVSKEFKRVIVFSDKQKQYDGLPRDIFWNDDLLKKADLKPPFICQLSQKIGIDNVISISELIERM